MDQSQDQSHFQHQVQVQKIAPHLIQASEILQCTTLELRQTIERELMENPALESIETTSDRCSDCEMPQGLCTHCPFADKRADRLALEDVLAPPSKDIILETAAAKLADDKLERDDYDREYERHEEERNEYEPDNELEWDAATNLSLSDSVDQHVKEEILDNTFDPLSIAPSTPNLRDHLLERLRSLTSGEREYRVCEYLVGCLDERGWLRLDRVEAMVSLSITEDVLDSAIAALQSCDPSGIGARDLQECMLLQLKQLAEDGLGNDLAQKIVENQWDLLVQRRYEQLARKTSSTHAQVEAAVHFIQSEISPSPANKYREPWNFNPDNGSDAIKPDVIVRRTSTGFDIEILGNDLPTLHINPRYYKMYEAMREQRQARFNGHASNGNAAVASAPHAGSLAAERNAEHAKELRHVSQYVERATLFLKNIQQRRKTIERITRCLIEAQQGFIDTGSRAFLVPMTRTELAHKAGLHESTVSRALLRKFVQLPTLDVVSFDIFFATAGSVKDTIYNIITSEDPTNPYSDEALREKLASMGIKVARRTIVKYRESLRLPASYLRRKH
jgi:RNA polymerase sigma-54 factor